MTPTRFLSGRRPAALYHARAGASWLGAILVLVLLAGICLGGGYLYWSFSASSAPTPPLLTQVTLGTFLHEVTERGEIESASNVEIRCQVQNKSSSGTSILWIIPEGTYVQPGDKLIELDSSALRSTETEQRIVYEQARAAVIQAELLHKTAQIAIQEYLEGTYKQELETISSEIFVAEENMRRAQDYAMYSEKLFTKGYITSVQLEADRFAVKNSELALQAAKTKRTVLEKYTRTKMLNQLESDERTAEAQMLAQKASFKLEEQKLQEVQSQIEKCVVFAPEAGQVVYANETDRRGSTEVLIAEGAMVRERQVMIRLPDIRRMQVKARVNEARVSLIKPDRPARVRVDALQGMVLTGTVTKVDSLPMPPSFTRGYVKEYAVLVAIDQPPSMLKPGMTADVTVEVNVVPDSLLVPVQAVLEKEGVHYCYQFRPEGPLAKPVKVGATNDAFVIVREGLTQEEQVILDPRSYLIEKFPQVLGTNFDPRFVNNASGRKKGKGPPAGKGAPGENGKPAERGGDPTVKKGEPQDISQATAEATPPAAPSPPRTDEATSAE